MLGIGVSYYICSSYITTTTVQPFAKKYYVRYVGNLYFLMIIAVVSFAVVSYAVLFYTRILYSSRKFHGSKNQPCYGTTTVKPVIYLACEIRLTDKPSCTIPVLESHVFETNFKGIKSHSRGMQLTSPSHQT